MRLVFAGTPAVAVPSLEALAARHRPIPLQELALVAADDFIGLMLPDDPPALMDLHLDCLAAAEPYRLSDPRADAARRAGRSLSPSMEANLQRWGYPYTGSDFRFHITLGGPPADAAERDALVEALTPMLIPARAGLMLDAVCVYEQPAAGAPFRQSARYPLSRA